MVTKKPEKLVTYYCSDCDMPFMVEQGSRRRYCDKHLLQRVKEGAGTRKSK